MKHKRIETTPEVWAAVMLAHRPTMVVFSSFSAPEGDSNGNPDEAIMLTEYGFKGCDLPVIGAETRWDVDHENLSSRDNMRHKYWLCSAVDDENQ